jgi:hypothetical protein
LALVRGSDLSPDALVLRAQTLQSLTITHQSAGVLEEAHAAIGRWVFGRSINDTFAFYTSTRARSRVANNSRGSNQTQVC